MNISTETRDTAILILECSADRSISERGYGMIMTAGLLGLLDERMSIQLALNSLNACLPCCGWNAEGDSEIFARLEAAQRLREGWNP